MSLFSGDPMGSLRTKWDSVGFQSGLFKDKMDSFSGDSNRGSLRIKNELIQWGFHGLFKEKMSSFSGDLKKSVSLNQEIIKTHLEIAF